MADVTSYENAALKQGTSKGAPFRQGRVFEARPAQQGLY